MKEGAEQHQSLRSLLPGHEVRTDPGGAPGPPGGGGLIYPWWLQAWVAPCSPKSLSGAPMSGLDWPLVGGALLWLLPLRIPAAEAGLCCCQGFISNHAEQKGGYRRGRVGKWPKLKNSHRALVAGTTVPDRLLGQCQKALSLRLPFHPAESRVH